MLPRRLRRLTACTYRGPRVYFVTVLTRNRRRLFDHTAAAVVCKGQLLRAAEDAHFAIRAGSVMPDHIHLIVEGLHGNSDFKRFMKLAKQLTGFHIKRMTGY